MTESNRDIVILAIESSCDDTAAAVIKNGLLLSNVVSSQLEHQQYGGVVPEIASRAHDGKILTIVQKALDQAGITKESLSAVAFTSGPGLMGSLLVGVSFGKAFALGLSLPIIQVNHMEAHILAHFIENPSPKFPFLCLTVSGGHTQIVLVNSVDDMTVLGKTIDDAAGEAFDKIGKMLGLAYPAGPVMDRLAQKGEPIFQFAKPNIEGLDYSFSGFKTSVLYFLKNKLKGNPKFIEENLNDLCRSVQENIVEILLQKLTKAAKLHKIKEIAIAGGVAANSGLKTALQAKGEQLGWNVYIPKMAYCTDNAGMIAMAAHFKYLKEDFCAFDVRPDVRMSVKSNII